VPVYNPGALGDLGGARNTLAEHGIILGGRYAGELAANTSGSLLGTAYSSEFALSIDFDLQKLTGTPGGAVHSIFTERFGSSLTANAIGNIASVQEIYGAGLTPRLTELDYQQSFDENKVNVRIGRVIMQNDYAAASSYWGGNLWCNYQTNAICGTPVAAPNNSGYGYYPASEWGVTVKLQPSDRWYTQAGAFQVNPVYGERGEGFNLSLHGDTGVMFPLETGVTFRNAAKDPLANLRLGLYYDTSNVNTAVDDIAKFIPPGNPAVGALPATMYRGRVGGWLLADALIAGSAKAGERGTALFAAFEYGDPQTAFISTYVEGGIVRHGTFSSRPLDTIAAGFDVINVNPRIAAEELALQNVGYAVPINSSETGLELNYGLQVAPSIVVRPGVQYILYPAGESAIVYPGGFAGLKNAFVFGLGTYIAF
jgi:porin